MSYSSKSFKVNEGIDNCGSIISESLMSTVEHSETVPVIMDTCPLLTEQMALNHGGHLRFDNRLFTDMSKTSNIKYPKEIDPYKTRREIVFISFICISICAVFGISFLENLQSIKPWDLRYCEVALCVIMLISCLLLLVYFLHSRSWTHFLFNSGFYVFPQSLQRKRTVVIFIWSASIFCFSPSLLAVRHLCHSNVTVSCGRPCIYGLSSYNFLQAYLAIATFITLIALVCYLVAVCRFRLLRRWPDIWHERLLEESSLIEHCPLIKTCELCIGNEGNTVSVSTHTEQIPSDLEIMKTQAYVIKYLRNLNNQLAMKIYHLNNEQRRVDANYPSTDNYDSRENYFDPSILSSVECRSKVNC